MDYEKLLNIAREGVKLAAENLKRLWDVPRCVSIKGDESLLTQIDAENEKILTEYFARVTPEFGFLGEETGIHAAKNSNAPYWYVDPVDGTSNMVHRFPWACVSVGLVVAGEPVVGVVNNPIQGHEFYAAQGLGAFLNGERIHVAQNNEFERALLATGFPVGPSDKEIANYKNFGVVSMKCHSVRRPGSAALDLCGVACGWLDGFWEINLKPWDTAAGVIIVREAGGVVTGFDGDKYDPHDKYIIATNGIFHKTLSDLVRKKWLIIYKNCCNKCNSAKTAAIGKANSRVPGMGTRLEVKVLREP